MPAKTINLMPSVAKAIDKLADEKQTQDTSHAEFLLSLAGMFESGQTDHSENVEDIIQEFILATHNRREAE